MPNRFKGITELKSNQDYEKLVLEGSITDKDGVQYEYDQLGELYITDDAVEEELRSSITNLQNRVDDLETSIGEGSTDLTDINNSITQINEDITEINTTISDLSSDKLDKNQTTDNTGKLLNVGLDGNITTLDSGTAGQILQSNGEDQAPTWVNKNAVEARVSDQSTYTASSITNSTDGIILEKGIGAGSIHYQTATYKVDGVDFAVERPNINTTEQMAFLSDVNNKLDANQGSENAGKVLTVGEDGSVTPQDAGMPSGSGGIIQLTGTAERPINLATSLTTGQLYSCKGVINAGTDYSFTSLGDTDDNFLLYKWSDTSLYALTCSSTNIDGVTHIFNGYQGICYILINRSGNITGVSNANFINLVHGSSSVEAGTALDK